jgi:hypothetical protein
MSPYSVVERYHLLPVDKSYIMASLSFDAILMYMMWGHQENKIRVK